MSAGTLGIKKKDEKLGALRYTWVFVVRANMRVRGRGDICEILDGLDSGGTPRPCLVFSRRGRLM